MFEEFEEKKNRGIRDVKRTLSALQERGPIFVALVFLDKIEVKPEQNAPEFVEFEDVFGYGVKGFLPGALVPQIPEVLERLKQKIHDKVST